jgi:predicted nucleic acid-binding protein
VHLVDTNVVSELMRPRPTPRVVEWMKDLEAIAMSVVSIEEIVFGLVLRPRSRMERVFDDFSKLCTIIPITEAIARRCSTMRALQRARGHARTQADMLIAATAAEHGAILVTRNVRDFEGCGIRVLDPFR